MLTYKGTGVDINAGEKAVQQIKIHVERTWESSEVSPERIEGFADIVVPLPRWARYKKQSSDTAGSKALLAGLVGKDNVSGRDAAAMSINDVACSGAEPLTITDIIVMEQQNVDRTVRIVGGVADAAVEGGCAIVDGEMAELPKLLMKDTYEVGTTVVGYAKSKASFFTSKRVQPGKVQLFGLPWDYPCSNGYSLILEVFGIDSNSSASAMRMLARHQDDLGRALGDALLEPTPIYTDVIRDVRSDFDVLGFGHITGGAMAQKVPRLLSAGCAVHIYRDAWEWPPIFQLIKGVGNIAREEMERVFHLGFPLVALSSHDMTSAGWVHIGEVVATDGKPYVHFV